MHHQDAACIPDRPVARRPPFGSDPINGQTENHIKSHHHPEIAMKVVVSSSSEFRRVKIHLILFVLAIVSVYMEIRSIFCSKKAIYVFSLSL